VPQGSPPLEGLRSDPKGQIAPVERFEWRRPRQWLVAAAGWGWATDAALVAHPLRGGWRWSREPWVNVASGAEHSPKHGVTPAEAGVHPDGGPQRQRLRRSIRMDTGLRRYDAVGGNRPRAQKRRRKPRSAGLSAKVIPVFCGSLILLISRAPKRDHDEWLVRGRSGGVMVASSQARCRWWPVPDAGDIAASAASL